MKCVRTHKLWIGFEGIFRFSEFKMLHTQFYLILKRTFKTCNLISLKLHENQMGKNGIIQHTETRANGLRNSSAHSVGLWFVGWKCSVINQIEMYEKNLCFMRSLSESKDTDRMKTMKMLSFQMNCNDRYFLKFCFH